MEKLFLQELKEMYGAEKHQTLLLPLLKRSACSLPLQSVLANHLLTTREHLSRLEEIFIMMDVAVEGRRSEAILGIGREVETVIASTTAGTATRDAGLILAAQKLEHYEISSYGNLAQMARTMEYDDVLEILESILYEEKELDEVLTALAENYINEAASQEYIG